MSVEAIEPLAIVATYDDLVAVLRQRIVELGVGMETVDAIAGLADRHTAKLLAPHPVKKLGPVSLGALLGALALRLRVESDDEALKQLRHRLTQRQPGGQKISAGPQQRAKLFAAAHASRPANDNGAAFSPPL
jgi:hypothetical protein